MHIAEIPAVSVCIPVYRGTAHLRQAIDSVLAQKFTDFELLIIDDHSPEDIGGIVNGYRDPRIHFLSNPENLGAEGNWNRCLKEARGRYFKLMPMDDLITSDCLEQQVEVLERDVEQRIALVFCARSIIDSEGHVILKRGYPHGKKGIISGTTLIRRCLRRGTNLIGEPGAVLMRRSLAEEVGQFNADIPYVIDLDYWFRLLLRGNAYYLPDFLAAFRVSQGSWSVRIGTGQSSEFRHFIAKTAQNPDFQARPIDVLSGNIMAHLNAFLRVLLYFFIIKRES